MTISSNLYDRVQDYYKREIPNWSCSLNYIYIYTHTHIESGGWILLMETYVSVLFIYYVIIVLPYILYVKFLLMIISTRIICI